LKTRDSGPVPGVHIGGRNQTEISSRIPRSKECHNPSQRQQGATQRCLSPFGEPSEKKLLVGGDHRSPNRTKPTGAYLNFLPEIVYPKAVIGGLVFSQLINSPIYSFIQSASPLKAFPRGLKAHTGQIDGKRCHLLTACRPVACADRRSLFGDELTSYLKSCTEVKRNVSFV
jgi:hypothetical protein